MSSYPTVQGCCPLGCGPTLFLFPDGVVACGAPACPEPDAVTSILADQETHHVVVIGAVSFTVRHPLRERLRDELMSCDLHEWLSCLDGPPQPPGRYRVRRAAGSNDPTSTSRRSTATPADLVWERLSEEVSAG